MPSCFLSAPFPLDGLSVPSLCARSARRSPSCTLHTNLLQSAPFFPQLFPAAASRRRLSFPSVSSASASPPLRRLFSHVPLRLCSHFLFLRHVLPSARSPGPRARPLLSSPRDTLQVVQ